MATSTWAWREGPILEAVAQAEANNRYPSSSDIETDSGLEERAVGFGLRALLDAGYLTGVDVTTGDDDGVLQLLDVRLLESGRRSVGAWPSEDTTFESFIALLDERIVDEPDTEKKSRLQRFRDGAVGVGRDVGIQFLTAYLKHEAGI